MHETLRQAEACCPVLVSTRIQDRSERAAKTTRSAALLGWGSGMHPLPPKCGCSGSPDPLAILMGPMNARSTALHYYYCYYY